MKEPNEYIIALGSNLWNRHQNLKVALDGMNQIGRVTLCSEWLENEPVGFESKDSFLNGVCVLHSSLEPGELLKRLKSIESELGRVKKSNEGYSSRPIDLDIVWWSGGVFSSDELQIPHPSMHERSFVLGPLCEIAPDYIHPMLQKTMSELYEQIR
jgi:2-amino-4-hydroxy-6-hydroxymethyldihydropteridine diphosphokinase